MTAPGQVVRRWLVEGFGGGERDALVGLLHPDCVLHEPRVPGGNARVVVAAIDMIHLAMEDRLVEILEMVESADTAAARFVLRGLHTGTLGTFVPAGREMNVDLAMTARVASGQIIEGWMVTDIVTHLQQMQIIEGTDGQADASEGGDPLEGAHPHRTTWARAWGLSPQLARAALLAMRGVARRDAAARLAISPSTLQSYLATIYERAGVGTRAELLVAAANPRTPQP